jgi:hypothetical protein
MPCSSASVRFGWPGKAGGCTPGGGDGFALAAMPACEGRGAFGPAGERAGIGRQGENGCSGTRRVFARHDRRASAPGRGEEGVSTVGARPRTRTFRAGERGGGFANGACPERSDGGQGTPGPLPEGALARAWRIGTTSGSAGQPRTPIPGRGQWHPPPHPKAMEARPAAPQGKMGELPVLALADGTDRSTTPCDRRLRQRRQAPSYRRARIILRRPH